MRISPKLMITMAFVLLLGSIGEAQTVKFSLAPTQLQAGEKGIIKATLTIPEGQKQTFNPQEPEYFTLSAEQADLVFGKVIYPKPTKAVSDEEWVYHPQVTLTLPYTVKVGAKPGVKKIAAMMSYNLCYDSGMCDPPEDVEQTLALTVIAKDAEAEPDFPPAGNDTPVSSDDLELKDSETSDTQNPVVNINDAVNTAEAADDQTPPPWQEIMKYILFAFLGGIILNITPCVLPILPIRIMSIMNQAQKDRSKVLNHTFVYTAGVLVSFAVLAGVFIALQQAGESAGWGLQNQNPGFVIALMAVVFIFALSLLGIFEIHAPGMSSATKATTRGGYSGSFFGGIFAFLMAISCTGPFLGAALPFALRLAPALMMVFFLTIGLGFAFPFLLIGFFPKALKAIPKPGDWMVVFKELMGFVLLYLVYTQLKTLLQLTSGEYLLRVIWFMILLGFSVWLYGRFVRMEHSKATQWVFTVLPVILIVLAAFTYLPMKAEDMETVQTERVSGEMVRAPHAPEGWYVFDEELFNKLQAEGKTVFLDIGAAWCKNCITNEKAVLFTDATMQEFREKGVILLRGDFTKKDAALFAWIKKHNRAGVPFNALYIPGQEPVLFNELISKGEISAALAGIK